MGVAATTDIRVDRAGGRRGPSASIGRDVICAAATGVAALLATGAAVRASESPPGVSSRLTLPALPRSEDRPLGVPGSSALPIGPTVGARTPAGPRLDAGVSRTLVPLGTVIALILVCAMGARRILGARGGLAAALGAAGRAPSGIIEVLARYPIARGHTLVLLKIDRRVLLLSQSLPSRLSLRAGGAPGFTTLCEITDPEEVAAILVRVQDAEGESISAKFRSLLAGADARHDEAGAEPDAAGASPRSVHTTEEGDRTELWSEAPPTLPFVSSAPSPEPPPGPARTPADEVGSLRRRLEAMRAYGASS